MATLATNGQYLTTNNGQYLMIVDKTYRESRCIFDKIIRILLVFLTKL